jgi:hypothetical protein
MLSFDLTKINHHPAQEEIVDILCNKIQNDDRGFFRAEAAYFFAKAASSMRATIETKDRGDIPVNMYSLVLANSGFGKGYSVHIFENELMRLFKERFISDTFPHIAEINLYKVANDRAAVKGTDPNEEMEKVKKEFTQAGAFPFTFDSATAPAVKQLRHKLLLANCGSVNLQIDEIGSNLLNNIDVLTLYLELYDQGMVKQKLTKNTAENQRNEDVDGKTPANALLFGTPSKLLDGGLTEEQFYSFLETGYARRCIFGFGVHNRASKTSTPEEIYEKLTKPANDKMVQAWSTRFHHLADPSIFGWRMKLPDNMAILLLKYRMECEKMSEDMPEHMEVQKAELAHRYFKVLKIAGAYAFIDRSMVIDESHLLPAIKLVEESGESFRKILNREKSYVRLAKFMATVGHPVTHADLHEALPFYKTAQSARSEMISLATAWGYKNHIIIKKTYTDNIELFEGSTLEETDLNKMIFSYSGTFAYDYRPEMKPFNQLPKLCTAPDYHWSNHQFLKQHRAEENAIAGFNMIVMDIDGTVSLEACHALMESYKFITYTTKRHTDDENRFRLILPMNYTLKLSTEEYKEFMDNVMNWMPFQVDPTSNQRAKKWSSHAGNFTLKEDGEMFDVLDFIPKTKRNEDLLKKNQELGNLDSLERWFAGKMASGNRNNNMIKYALCLLDAGWRFTDIKNQVLNFNAKLAEPLAVGEIEGTIFVTVGKKFYENP